jgi:hypothetical protein
MLAFAAVLLLLTRPWSSRVAWTGTVAMVLQIGALGSVVGMELFGAVLVQEGVPVQTVQHGMDGMTSNPAGVVLAILFFPTELVAFIALGAALWRTGWVPRTIPVLMWAFPVLDMTMPNHPKGLHVVAFALFLGAFAWLAILVLRDGAPRPPEPEHTA